MCITPADRHHGATGDSGVPPFEEQSRVQLSREDRTVGIQEASEIVLCPVHYRPAVVSERTEGSRSRVHSGQDHADKVRQGRRP